MINLEQALSILSESKKSLLLLVEDYSQSHVSRKFLIMLESYLTGSWINPLHPFHFSLSAT